MISTMSKLKRYNIDARRSLAGMLNVTEQSIKVHEKNGRVLKEEDGRIKIDETFEILHEYYNTGKAGQKHKIKVNKQKHKEKNKKEQEEQEPQKVIIHSGVGFEDIEQEQKKMLEEYERGELSIARLLSVFDYDLIKKIEIVEKTRKQKIDNDEREKNLIARSTVEGALEVIGKNLNNRLMEIPNRLSSELAGIDDPLDVKIYLKNEITNILQDFAQEVKKINA